MEIASGMFVPMLLIGAVLGRLAGLLMVDLFSVDPGSMWWLPASDDQWKWVDPGVFAVVGAAAFMGGVTRLTVALAAIMMEVRVAAPPVQRRATQSCILLPAWGCDSGGR